jgi:hypothetical protein
MNKQEKPRHLMSAGSNIMGIVREPFRDPARLADTDLESAQTNNGETHILLVVSQQGAKPKLRLFCTLGCVSGRRFKNTKRSHLRFRALLKESGMQPPEWVRD